MHCALVHHKTRRAIKRCMQSHCQAARTEDTHEASSCLSQCYAWTCMRAFNVTRSDSVAPCRLLTELEELGAGDAATASLAGKMTGLAGRAWSRMLSLRHIGAGPRAAGPGAGGDRAAPPIDAPPLVPSALLRSHSTAHGCA